MAAAGSSVVELCTLAEAGLDAATSAKFFRDDDDDGAGGAINSSFSWPEAGRTSSRLFDQSALQALCDKYKVPTDYSPMSLDGRWVACQTPPEGSERCDTIFVYADALEAGMRVPLHELYVEVLVHYGLAPSQLAPDAWRYMAAFVLLCQDAGVEPSLPVFRAFFSICTHEGDSVGWHHFRSRPGRRRCLFNGKVPRSPDPEWKARFFLLRRSPAARPWPCPVKWGKPSKAAVRMPVVTCETDMVMKKLLDRAGNFLSPRRSPPPPVAPPQVSLTLTLTPPPPPEPARKRKSFADTRTRGRELVDSIAEASELAKMAMAELDDTGKELLAARAEVAQLKEALAASVDRLNGDHAVAVTRLKEKHRMAEERHEAEVAKLQAEHAAAVARLEEEHAASVDRLKEEHAADVARVKDAAHKEVQDAKKKIVLRLFPKLNVALLERRTTGTPKGEGRS